MPKNKLFRVPFTYTLSGVALIVAADAEAARDSISDSYSFDDSGLDESNIFWDEGADILQASVAPTDPNVGQAEEVTEPERVQELLDMYTLTLDEEEEIDDDAENPRSAG